MTSPTCDHAYAVHRARQVDRVIADFADALAVERSLTARRGGSGFAMTGTWMAEILRDTVKRLRRLGVR